MATELPLTADELNPATLCIHCMQRKPVLAPCPACGHKDIPSKQHPLYLKPRTLLKQQYIVGKALGQGGFGITYIGFDRWLHKKVAIKEYLPAALATRDFREASVIPLKRQEDAFTQGLGLFIEEARNLAKFDHPHIVRVLNFFEENQTGYMVMEYLEGNSLGDYLAQHGGKLSLSQALEIFRPILDALDVVHAEHLYHRDISAQNIRMLTNGTPILIDFGAARHVIGEHSHTLDLVLKHGYSPIEQYSGRGKIGAWTDIYACGALLYLLLTGSLPPAATDRLSEEPLLPLNRLPTHVEATILKALALKAEQRFTDISAFKTALYDEVSPAPPPLAPKNTRKIPQFARVVFIVLLLGLVLEKLFMQHKLEQLQQQAAQQWAAQHLITPQDNNVYATYQTLLALDPQNQTALQGLQQLKQHFVTLAKTQQQRADFNTALATVEQGLSIAPEYVELRTLQQALTVQIQQAIHEQKLSDGLKFADKLIAQGQLEEAQQHYQHLRQLAPEDVRIPQALNNLARVWAHKLENSHEPIAQRLKLLNQLLNEFPQQTELLALKTELTAPKPVEELLRKAEQHLANSRLSEPKGENAYELYQQVLNLEPEQAQAKQGIHRIADNYAQRAERESNPAKALLWVNKGLKVLPSHAGLLNLQKTLTAPPPVTVPVEIPKTVAQPSPPSLPPNPIPTTPEPNVNGLLQTAQQQLEREQWEMAGQNYQAVLKLVADNSQAQQGLQKIAAHYLQLARKAQQQARWVESLSFINKGLQFVPHHAGLLGLQRDAMQQLNEPAVTPAPSNLILTPSF